MRPPGPFFDFDFVFLVDPFAVPFPFEAASVLAERDAEEFSGTDSARPEDCRALRRRFSLTDQVGCDVRSSPWSLAAPSVGCKVRSVVSVDARASSEGVSVRSVTGIVSVNEVGEEEEAPAKNGSRERDKITCTRTPH
jgi:hypothetical protein